MKKTLPAEALEFFRQAGAKGGKQGAAQGGKKRAESLTAKRRSDIARKAAAARWAKKGVPPMAAPTYGEKFRKQRVLASKSLGDVARTLQLSAMYISDIERGRRGPLDNAQTIEVAKLFGIDPTDLLKTAAQERGQVTVKTDSDAAVDLLTSLARGKRPEKTYRELLDVLRRRDREK
jgi:transcriptional regulator with XRE-family HTH domain